jgi:hypothetical protein
MPAQELTRHPVRSGESARPSFARLSLCRFVSGANLLDYGVDRSLLLAGAFGAARLYPREYWWRSDVALRAPEGGCASPWDL